MPWSGKQGCGTVDGRTNSLPGWAISKTTLPDGSAIKGRCTCSSLTALGKCTSDLGLGLVPHP